MVDEDYRTSAEKVRLELEADGTPIDEITNTQLEIVGLDPASLDVEELLADSGMSEKRLALIERYLAGHYILSSGVDALRQVDSETLSDGANSKYAGDRDHSDYRSTSLGQKAVAADQSNTLVNASKPSASISVPDARGRR